MKSKVLTFSYGFSNAARQILAACMIFLLLLLTSMNFFVYNNTGAQDSYACAMLPGGDTDDSNNAPCNPGGPDEKPPGTSISINEEYVHEQEETVNPYIINEFQYGISGADKLYVVHFEIIVPPPRQA